MKTASQQGIVRELSSPAEIEASAGVIREAFGTVAVQFNLTRENCPTHPSFITADQLRGLKDKGLIFFGLFNGNQTGFIAVEKAENGIFYIEKLAVLPEYRHRGYGRSLVEYAFDYIRNKGGKTVSIGIIDEHTILKEWYRDIGFKETGTRRFPHLPFTVCFMEMELSGVK